MRRIASLLALLCVVSDCTCGNNSVNLSAPPQSGAHRPSAPPTPPGTVPAQANTTIVPPQPDYSLKFLILTHYTNNLESYAKLAIENQQAYASHFGYLHLAENGIISNEFSDPQKSDEVRRNGLYWQKIAAIEYALNDTSLSFDWILWIDSDAVFTNFDNSLASIVAQFGANKDLIVPLDATDSRIHINNGVFLIRNSAWAHQFFHTIAKLYRHYKDKGTPEQDAMRDLIYSNAYGSQFKLIDSNTNFVLESDAKDSLLLRKTVLMDNDLSRNRAELDSRVAVVPQRVMDSFWRDRADPKDAQWVDGDFIMHVSGISTSKRAEKIKEVTGFVADRNKIDEGLFQQFKHCGEHDFSAQSVNGLLSGQSYRLSVSIKNNQITTPSLSQFYEERLKAQEAISLIERAQRRYGRLPDVEFVINLLDEQQIPLNEGCKPLFSFGVDRTKFHDLLFVFPFTFNDLQSKLERMENSRIPWSQKIDKLVWRGTQTSGRFTKANWKDKARSRLVIWCRDHAAMCDAGFSGFSRQVDEDAKWEIEKSNLLKSPIEEKDMQRYRYIASVDGNTFADRLARLLASNSLVMKQESNEAEFWYPALQSYIHYVPLAHDMSNLESQINFARTHRQQVEQIIENAQRLVKEQLSDFNVDRYIFRIISTLADYQKRGQLDVRAIENALYWSRPVNRS